MDEKTKFPNLEQRIALFDLMITLNQEHVKYFGNANCALIMQVLQLEQYEKFRELGKTDYSVGVTLAYISERTGLSKSTVHDQLNKMLKQNIFVRDGQKFKFRIDPDGLPTVQTELPKGVAALRKFSNFSRAIDLSEE